MLSALHSLRDQEGVQDTDSFFSNGALQKKQDQGKAAASPKPTALQDWLLKQGEALEPPHLCPATDPEDHPSP